MAYELAELLDVASACLCALLQEGTMKEDVIEYNVRPTQRNYALEDVVS